MQLASAPLGDLSGHEAGRQLLCRMYRQYTGKPMPNILTGEMGKPYFEDGSLHFSISHTKRRVFCAISEKPIGIDAEEMDREIPLHLAEKILSAGEYRHYDRAADKRETLLRFWVLKEAFVKHSGKGLGKTGWNTDFSPDDTRVQILDGCFVAVME